MLLLIATTALLHLAQGIVPRPHAYHIQTDEGDSRFFQFSSGPSGHFRRESLLPNGTVVGAYSWRDGRGMTRLYMYVADSAGYRVVESEIGEEENTISDDEKEDGTDHDIKYNTRKFKRPSTDPILRGKRKVLVKRQKSRQPVSSRPGQVIVKRLGLALDVIPYQSALLLSNQYPGRRGERRLLGERDLVTVTETPGTRSDSCNKGSAGSKCILSSAGDPEHFQTSVVDSGHLPSTVGDSGDLPSFVLLSRVKVQPVQRRGHQGEAGKDLKEENKIGKRRRKKIRKKKKKKEELKFSHL